MSKELAKAYELHEVEDRIYDFWLKEKFFHGFNPDKKPYTIVRFPPPKKTFLPASFAGYPDPLETDAGLFRLVAARHGAMLPLPPRRKL